MSIYGILVNIWNSYWSRTSSWVSVSNRKILSSVCRSEWFRLQWSGGRHELRLHSFECINRCTSTRSRRSEYLTSRTALTAER